MKTKVNRYILYQKGYEPYIDFLKGYMIMCILFTHACMVWQPLRDYSLYYLWGCAPTGCFMLISTLHFYRNGLGGGKLLLKKQLQKVLLPFLIMQVLIIIVVIIFRSPQHYDYNRIMALIQTGGYGVGSYFPWVYIQYQLLMVALTPLVKAIRNKALILTIFVILSLVSEVSVRTLGQV